MAKKIVILLLAPCFLFWHWFEPAARKNQQGIQLYEDKNYAAALAAFLSAKGIRPDAPQLRNNTAATLYELKKYQESLDEFAKINIDKPGIDRASFFYNMGNAHFRAEQLDKALDYYKKSLLANPNDIEAKKNYEITLQKMQNQNQQQNQEQKNQQEQKEQEQQKQQQKNYQSIMQYLNQNEKQQLEKKKRSIALVRNERDW